MIWFKHYVNASDDNKLVTLEGEIRGGQGIYWRMVELCAAQWNEGDPTVFVFHRKILRKKLQINGTKLSLFCQNSARILLFSYKTEGDLWHFDFPKIAEIFHKDGLPKKTQRLTGPPLSGLEQNKNNNKNIHTETDRPSALSDTHFQKALEEYQRLFPGSTAGQQCKPRFLKHIRNEMEFADFLKSMQNYRTFLNQQENQWRTPKTSMATFIGTDRSGLFWMDFETLDGALNASGGQSHFKPGEIL